jgi:hypothetical protein
MCHPKAPDDRFFRPKINIDFQDCLPENAFRFWDLQEVKWTYIVVIPGVRSQAHQMPPLKNIFFQTLLRVL